jgi:hypothetical protein
MEWPAADTTGPVIQVAGATGCMGDRPTVITFGSRVKPNRDCLTFKTSVTESLLKKHDWNKEKPHHVDDGKITRKDYAEKNPGKVEWVKDKPKK